MITSSKGGGVGLKGGGVGLVGDSEPDSEPSLDMLTILGGRGGRTGASAGIVS